MKHIFRLVILFCSVWAQDSLNVIRTDQTLVPGANSYNDIWGFTKGDTTYALISMVTGFGIYRIDDAGKAHRVFSTTEGDGQVWGELRYYKDYVYKSTESGPVRIYKLNWVDSTVSMVASFARRTHNIYLYEDKLLLCGFIGSAGPNTDGGAEMWSLSDLENPELEWTYDEYYVHDLMVADDRLYMATGAIGNRSSTGGRLIIYDISNVQGNKLGPEYKILEHPYTNGFTHNIWPTPDHKYVVTTDEQNRFDHLQFWDISDLNNVKNLMKHREGSASIVHNAFIKNDFIYSSYYDRGVVIHDISDKQLPIKVGEYDTYPEGNNHSTGDFNGAWGVYPFFNNDVVLVSDQSHGLNVVKFDQTQRAGTFIINFADSSGTDTLGADATLNVADSREVKFVLTKNRMRIKAVPGKVHTFYVRINGVLVDTIQREFALNSIDSILIDYSSPDLQPEPVPPVVNNYILFPAERYVADRFQFFVEANTDADSIFVHFKTIQTNEYVWMTRFGNSERVFSADYTFTDTTSSYVQMFYDAYFPEGVTVSDNRYLQAVTIRPLFDVAISNQLSLGHARHSAGVVFAEQMNATDYPSTQTRVTDIYRFDMRQNTDMKLKFTATNERAYLQVARWQNGDWVTIPSRQQGRNVEATVDRNGVYTVIQHPGQKSEVAAGGFELHPNFPNPFNPVTTISYYLPTTAAVKLTIYNALGQQVAQPVDAVQPSGLQQFQWNARQPNGQLLPSGLYFYVLESGSVRLTRKLILMK